MSDPATLLDAPAVTAPAPAAQARRGLAFEPLFTRPGEDPFATVAWERRDAVITGVDGRTVFEQRGVEVPAGWSQTATNVVASKYFRGRLGSPERETSVRQMVGRVVDAIAGWGREDGLLADDGVAAVFRAELAALLLHQRVSFNSPVWFNVGVKVAPQCSACFILSVEDTMESILGLATTEAMLFKHGSGTGSNLSTLRSSRESLSGGGTAGGPVSFMRGFDAFAGVVKSGGTTRRAAKMVVLDVDHPDVEAFVRSKEIEEGKARALVAAGYDGGLDAAGGAYESLGYQNANHSVRVGDAFMRAVEEGASWSTHAVQDGRVMDSFPARELMATIARAAWACGDPGMQFDDTTNAWHTCPASGRIRASNPCSEYVFLDDTACNLASLNLLRFAHPERGFDVRGFEQAVRVVLVAQEILVGHASYPTPAVTANSHRYRTLGLGYANLGALLMARGLAYDSDAGRALAATLTALMTGAAYAASAEMASAVGAFAGYAPNREPMLGVVRRHRAALDRVGSAHVEPELARAARDAWDAALAAGERHGFRNAQVTVLAPTGTIAFMMDCDTTGVEPELALVKTKRMVGGGTMKLANRTVPVALDALGYDETTKAGILAHLEREETIEGAPDLAPEHLAVFDCAFPSRRGGRAIAPSGHLAMMAAVQPFLSGAISKTINLPEDTPPEAIEKVFMEAWRAGLKAVAVYRDGCKSAQPLVIGAKVPKAVLDETRFALRRRLPDERRAITHKFRVADHEGYVTVGLYDDGTPGEIFLVMAKEGSTISGLMDAFATSVSIALQYGVPLEALVRKFSHARFEPAGFTGNPQIPMAKSVVDYIFRWLAAKFLDVETQRAVGIVARDGDGQTAAPIAPPSAAVASPPPLFDQRDAPSCATCGELMVRSGTCYKCLNCGSTSGCS